MYSRSIIGIGTEPVPLVSCLLTTRYVRGIGTRIDRARLATERRGEKDGRPCRVGRVVWSAYGVAGSLRRGCCCCCCNGFGSLPAGAHRSYRVMFKVALVQRGPISGHFLFARDITALFVHDRPSPDTPFPKRKKFELFSALISLL